MKKLANKNEIYTYLTDTSEEFAVVKNPGYSFPPFEIYPLAEKILSPRKKISGIVMDMDGTTTTTETLCIHSLEYMVRQAMGEKGKRWLGLDKTLDYPNIIGNSTTRHIEFLIEKYKSDFDDIALKKTYLKAALWFLSYGKDEKRIEEVKTNLINLGGHTLIVKFEKGKLDSKSPDDISIKDYVNNLSIKTFSDYVRIGIDIYYQRYHEILSEIEAGNGEKYSKQLLTESDKHLIAPMPGVGEFIALTKGWLGDEVINLYEELLLNSGLNINDVIQDKLKNNLIYLSNRFSQNPVKIGVVTSSILYEAKIVLKEVYRVLVGQINKWNISNSKKEFIIQQFSDYQNIYDGFITASDSSEIRLKPHRDLYSIALHQLGIAPKDFDNVIGFEDSESGTIAIRAAGIGLCCAVPFADTSNHDLQAATFILNNGLPEAILKHNLFLEQD